MGVGVGMFPEKVAVDMFVVVSCFRQYSEYPYDYQHDNDGDLQVVQDCSENCLAGKVEGDCDDGGGYHVACCPAAAQSGRGPVGRASND